MRRKARQKDQLHIAPGRNECGKVAYLARASAKWAGKRHVEKMRPYACSTCGLWHLGHLPRAVRRGELTADEWYGNTTGEVSS